MADSSRCATGRIERTIAVRITLDEGLDVGDNTCAPVNLSFDVPLRFLGKINQVMVEWK